MMTHYDLLGVTRDADLETIKQAHRRALKACHPDLKDGDERADRRSRQINAAYDVLKDMGKRAKYDAYLRQRRQNLRVLAITCLLTAAMVGPVTFLLLTGLLGTERDAPAPAPTIAMVPQAVERGSAIDRASAAFAEMAAAEKAAMQADSPSILETATPPDDLGPTAGPGEDLGPRTLLRLGQTKNPFDLLVFAETFPGTPEASFAVDRLGQLIHCSDNIPELITLGGKATGHIADMVRDRLMTLIRANPPKEQPGQQRRPAGETAIADARGTASEPVASIPAPADPSVGQTLPTSASEPALSGAPGGAGKPALGAAPAGPAGGENFAEIVPVNAEDAESYLRRAAAWIGRGNLDRALDDYDMAIRLDRGSVAAFRGRGMLWRQRGDTEKALADLDQAVRLDYHDADVYRERGLVWQQRGRYDRAIADFSQAIRLAPDYAMAYLFRGEALLHKGEFRNALADFDHALRLVPTLADALRGRALAQVDAENESRPVRQ